MARERNRTAGLVALLLVLVGCSGGPAPTVVPTPATVVESTASPGVTSTSQATVAPATPLALLQTPLPVPSPGTTSPAPRAGATPQNRAAVRAKPLVGAYWYAWYDSDGRHWKQGYRGTPALGQYASGDPQVIAQQIDWAAGHGIDFFAASWWGAKSFEDNVIRTRFLAAPSAGRMRFAILYESGVLLKRTGASIDLDDNANRTKFVEDMKYVASTFFHRPNYLQIGGRPVVFLYLSRVFAGNVALAMGQARAAVKTATGKDMFIVGDEVYWQPPAADRLKLYDGVTGYNMHAARPDIADGFAAKVVKQYQLWSQAADTAGVAFIPGVIPGFDDTAVRPADHHPIIPRSPELFGDLVRGSLPLANGASPMLMITSWNEWHEYTSIEPGREFGTTYLDVLQRALAGP